MMNLTCSRLPDSFVSFARLIYYVVCCVFCLAFAAEAQLPAPNIKPALGARMPALSPKGTKLAFVYRGDVWVSDAGGGRAYAVTQHTKLDAYPLFSPDGQWLAFSSMRNGNWDIFVVPVTGGEARQLTFSSGSEIATDWSPDGKYLLFSGARDTPDSTLFALEVATLRFSALTRDYKSLGQAAYAPNGKTLVFTRHGFPWNRPRYKGSAAAQLWTLNLPNGERAALTQNEFQHLWPRFMPDGKSVVAVSVGQPTASSSYLGKPALPLSAFDNADRTPNLWLFSTEPISTNGEQKSKPQRLTNFVGDGVRCPAVARQTGDIVFEYGHDLYLLPQQTRKPERLTLFCGAEDKQNNLSREVLTSGVQEAEISPDGKTFAFAVRGDIWTIPIEKPKTRNADDANRLTDYAGFDRDFVWAADGKTLYFVSDRAFNDRVYALETATQTVKPIWTGSADARRPKVSPDGKMLGFWVAGPADEEGKGTGGLYVKPIPGAPTPTPTSTPSAATTPAAPASPSTPTVAPSPPGSQAAPSATTNTAEAGKSEDVAPRRIIALPMMTQGDFSWSPDMKWIAYTRRSVESGAYNVWITPADGLGKAVNVTRLNAWHGMPNWSPDGKYLFFASNRNGDGLYVLPLKPEEARADELEVKFEKPKQPVKVEIDFEDTVQRIRRLTTQNPQADLTATAEGQIYFVSEGDAWSCSYDGKEVKRLTSGGGVSHLRSSADGKSLFFVRQGNLFTMKVKFDKEIPAAGESPVQVAFSAVSERDIHAERKAAFTEFWRSYNTRFYDGNFHGRDWAAIRERYEPLLDAVGTRDEFASLLNRMVGELEASHSEVGPAPSPVTGPSTRYLGIYYDYSYQGPGIRVLDVPKRAPGFYSKTRIKPGEYIMAVDGKAVTLDENLFKTLNDKGDKDFELLVNDKPTREGARTVKFKALGWGEWGDIHYRNRIDRLRQATENKSNGKIAYVHIAGMGGANQTAFDRELYEYAEGKQAVIIDVRFNGGGNIADTLINWLGLKPYGTYRPRDSFREPSPARGWNKPIVILMNEHSMSNAEMFPHGMRAAGLAKLVGMPTPGYVIWTTGLGLVDGTSARMPLSGVYRLDGSPMENQGEQPDVKVPLSNEDWLAERDPQLDKAIEILLQNLPL